MRPVAAMDNRPAPMVHMLGGSWAMMTVPRVHLPTDVVMEAVSQTGRWRPPSIMCNVDYDEIAGLGFIQCENCRIGLLEAMTGRRRLGPLDELSSVVSHRCQAIEPNAIFRIMGELPPPPRLANRVLHCRFARAAYPDHGCYGTLPIQRPQLHLGQCCDFCDASGQECHACHWIAHIANTHYCSSCLAARFSVVFLIDIRFLPPDGLLQVVMRLLSGDELAVLEFAQLYQRREPCSIELYRILVQVALEARFLEPISSPISRVAANGYTYTYESFLTHYGTDAQRQWLLAALRMVSVYFVGTEVRDRQWGLLDVMDGENVMGHFHQSWYVRGGLGGLRRLVVRAHAHRNPYDDEAGVYIPPLWN